MNACMYVCVTLCKYVCVCVCVEIWYLCMYMYVLGGGQKNWWTLKRMEILKKYTTNKRIAVSAVCMYVCMYVYTPMHADLCCMCMCSMPTTRRYTYIFIHNTYLHTFLHILHTCHFTNICVVVM